MSRFMKTRLSLDDAMRSIDAKWTGKPHITYDPTVKHQYRIIRQQSHDGTLMSTYNLIQNALSTLFNRSSYYVPMGVVPEDCDVIYTVGTIKIATVFGSVDLHCGRYPGQRERITIPVRCEYAKKNNQEQQ